MNRKQWVLLIVATLVSLFLAWCALPPRRPLVPSRGLAGPVRLAVVIDHPAQIWQRLCESALVNGLFTYDPAAAEQGLSATARATGLPPLEPPVRLDAAQRAQVTRALDWLRPTQAAVVQIDQGDTAETWLGVQGARVRLVGRLAGWFSNKCVCGESVWIRLSDKAPQGVLPPAAGAWDWPRLGISDIRVVLPRGIPSRAAGSDPADVAHSEAQKRRQAATLAAVRLPVACERLELDISARGGRLTWEGRVRGAPPPVARVAGPGISVQRRPRLPAPSEPGVFLTLYADVDWARLYRGQLAAMDETERADFERSMRWYRMKENGYDDPEGDFLAALGRGLAAVGRRGPRYNGTEWMPAVQAELPLTLDSGGIMSLVGQTPNQKFRKMMPDFAEARFDKVRRMERPNFGVHPSYVAVSLGAQFDRYVLLRPTIAGSALMPAWQVDDRKVKIGTRPDTFDDADLFLPPQIPSRLEPVRPELTLAAETVFAVYFDPAAITDQLDNFRILVKVEAGSDRPKPDDGLTVARIEEENKRVVATTEKNMRLAAQVGWVLQRLGPLEMKVAVRPDAGRWQASIRGSVGLKQAP